MLALVRARHPDVASQVTGFDEALRRGLDFAAATGLVGHGWGATFGTIEALHVLADGGIPELLVAEPELSPRLFDVLRAHRSALANLAPRAPRRGCWGVPDRVAIEDAVARLRGMQDA
jgi:hypothetical protein